MSLRWSKQKKTTALSLDCGERFYRHWGPLKLCRKPFVEHHHSSQELPSKILPSSCHSRKVVRKEKADVRENLYPDDQVFFILVQFLI